VHINLEEIQPPRFNKASAFIGNIHSPLMKPVLLHRKHEFKKAYPDSR